MKFFRYQELISELENSSGLTTEGLHDDFAKMSILYIELTVVYLGVVWYQEFICDNE